ncbi:hypothetical protein Mgra_00003110 [Meloidogyne graminicola]|uniref:Uncharacterized protein n=1 Tax=Meloidogyne graminicola TaxID=189291 RepID=A0A8S9ZVR3_9BILA|nr:hypothetical protein Mgra_00003110 [Meloidogyne graminicola]
MIYQNVMKELILIGVKIILNNLYWELKKKKNYSWSVRFRLIAKNISFQFLFSNVIINVVMKLKEWNN